MYHFADRLNEQIKLKGAPVCAGIDPVVERLPEELAPDPRDHSQQVSLDAIFEFVTRVIGAVAPHVPCVKIQSACFERFHWDGVECYNSLVHDAKSKGLIVIGDVKRGDIGTSAAHYAAGCLEDPPNAEEEEVASPDAITVSSYFGIDGLSPFLKTAQEHGQGVFALVRTSNPGGDAIQSLELKQGGTVAEAVGALVAQIGSDSNYVGSSGYSLLGAVVGATKPADARRLRELMPQQIFLVPGFGAQGGGADDVRACFKDDGTGALITASRSINYAYEKTGTEDWVGAIEEAAADMRKTIADIL